MLYRFHTTKGKRSIMTRSTFTANNVNLTLPKNRLECLLNSPLSQAYGVEH